MENHDEEIMELKHKAIPGYMPIFWAVFVLGIIYLAVVFVFAEGGGGH